MRVAFLAAKRMTGRNVGFMIVNYDKRIKKSELIKILVATYRRLSLDKLKSRDFREGSAEAVGMVVGYFGINPKDIVIGAIEGKTE